MKNKTLYVLMTLFLLGTLVACSKSPKESPTPDIQATVNAAVNAAVKTSVPVVPTVGAVNPTIQPSPDVQSTVGAAIQATAAAGQVIQPTVVPAAQSTVVVMPPAPTAVPPVGNVYYTGLSEEELAALIDHAVAEAQQYSQQVYASTTQATSDGNVSDGETQTIQVNVSTSGQAVTNAEALINEYQALYGDYASEYLNTLTQIEQDLASISESTAQIAAILEQGSQAATQAIAQLNAAAQSASTKAAELQTKSKDLQQKLQADLNTRLEIVKKMKPNQLANDKMGAIQQTFGFLDALKGGLSGGKLGSNQFKQIAQLGVNASASLKAQGGPQLQHFAGNIDQLNMQMAHGQYPQARKGADSFEKDFQGVAKRPGRK